MMSLTFGLFNQVSGLGPLGPLVVFTTNHHLKAPNKNYSRRQFYFYLWKKLGLDFSCESSARGFT